MRAAGASTARFARSKARSYFLVGADREDIVQEGMIGLYKAIRDFNPDLQTLVPRLRRAVRHAPDHHRDQDRDPAEARPAQQLRVVLAAGAGGDDDGERVPRRRAPDRRDQRPGRPGHLRRAHPRAAGSTSTTVLSDLEAEVLRLYVEGKSYQEIAERLQRHVKSIDNALQRIKRKLDGHLQAREVADAG